ncbi:hypothetical protein RN001_010587 [Aquatica leii]|uniref:Regulatory protein zeste n=1 Tax=Aquatica leii TaxID=1421715 RepID=A0AAN7P9V2_9COLE|nr:hypothetical protein RN001_010587 [Aquatica leii]
MNKSKRATNFSFKEEEILLSLVNNRKSILECKKTDVLSSKEKDKAWHELEKEYNANSSTHRDAITLRRKYENMKKRSKKKYADEKKYVTGTGGGGPLKSNFNEMDETMKNILGERMTGMHSVYDDDADNCFDSEVIIDNYGDNEVIESSPIEETAEINDHTYNKNDIADNTNITTSDIPSTSTTHSTISRIRKPKKKVSSQEKWFEVGTKKIEVLNLQLQHLEKEHQLKMDHLHIEHKLRVEVLEIEKKIKNEQLKNIFYGDRIIGGTAVNIEDFPYQVSIEINAKHECGGSILSPRKILTAGHCTFNESVSAFQVRAGSTFSGRGGQLVSVQKKIEHPDFNPDNYFSDLSILILSESLVLNNKVKTITIANTEDVPVGTAANLTGWGLTEANEFSDRLLLVNVPRADDTICVKEFTIGFNTTVQLCYGGVVGKDSCSKDSGGPLVINAYGNRIIGGTEANIEDFPYQVSVEYNNGHSCGGSIITPTKILTAAHCTLNQPVNRYRVRAGSTWRNQGGQVVNVIKKIEHPDYSSATVSSDLSILILSEPLILNDKVRTINIAQTEDVPAGTMANVTGWGKTEAGVMADRLLLVSVPKVDTPTCKIYYGPMYNATTMICYGGVVGKDSCSNDSGGPLAIDGEQHGVVSFGASPCGGKSPGIYVKLHYFRDFIANTN